ncbi:MAG: acyl carrier protein [Planctomycetes bacterium]|nr:acyl carrier protein [Planctomycetota bacterium]
MSNRKHEEALRDLLATISTTDVSSLGLDEDLVRELGLDSLAGLRLLAAVEKRFDVHFPDDRLGEFRTMRQLLDIIASKERENEP